MYLWTTITLSARLLTMKEKKIDILRAEMKAQNWRKAISVAVKFPRLGGIRNAVHDAHLAYTNPRFVVQIGKQPSDLIEQGKAALVTQYL